MGGPNMPKTNPMDRPILTKFGMAVPLGPWTWSANKNFRIFKIQDGCNISETT